MSSWLGCQAYLVRRWGTAHHFARESYRRTRAVMPLMFPLVSLRATGFGPMVSAGHSKAHVVLYIVKEIAKDRGVIRTVAHIAGMVIT